MDKRYTIGLDIGTNSVGWAVIDDNFNLVKGKKHIVDNGIKKKVRTNLWGARLFDKGNTADERRGYRGSSRRIQRRHERINYLRGIFEQEILKIDESFFIRLDESFYQLEDKGKKEFMFRDENGVLQTSKINDREIYKYPLFINEDEEKKYYNSYHTIYHLRSFLMNSDEKADIRLIYLALHHILKHRGHFINQGQTFDFNNLDVAENLQNTLRLYGRAVSFNFGFENVDNDKANEILNNDKMSRSQKVYELNKLYTVDDEILYLGENISYLDMYESMTAKQRRKYIEDRQKQVKALFTAIVGNKIDLKAIFDNGTYYNEANETFPKNIYYKNEDFDDVAITLESILEPEEMDVLMEGRKVYEAIILTGILTKDTLSDSMVLKYEQHREQLDELKKFTKNISREMYVKFFGKDGVYSKYIDGTGNPTKKTTRDEFYKEIKDTFEKFFDGLEFPKEDKPFDWSKSKANDEQKKFFETISDYMSCDSYLPKQRMSDNGAIPYQVHEAELIKIIEKQGKFYPFLIEKSGDSYKLQKLMTFRIPYYVGPLTEASLGKPGRKTSQKSSFAWMQKRKEGKITPWNFDEIVDKDASAVEFIQRMTSFCTYLPNEKVLAQNTLLYQEFCVCNELIVSGYFENGKKFYFGKDKKLLNDLVRDVFKNGKGKKISQTAVLDYLKQEKGIDAEELFGIDKRSVNGAPSFNNCLSTYHDLRNIGISSDIIDNNVEIFDEIITWQTIFTDKKSLKNRLENANEEWKILDSEQIEKLSNKHYTGFGRLSKKLLDGIRDKKTGLTIIETLKFGNDKHDNFMRLVSGETAEAYSFKKQIEVAQTEKQPDVLSYDIVEQLAGSPAIKRGIWQSLKILKELEKYLGRHNIAKVVIEMSRDNDGDRTKSRYKQLIDQYKSFEDANREVFDELKTFEKNEKALDNERLHLYFRQNGKDAYNKNNELHIEYLSDYEVDHIIPQSFLKDDSIDNKVLVSKISNQQKGGDVPSMEIINEMRSTWKSWVKAGLISQKKLKHLTTGKLTVEVKEGFINRQLVENRQITKHVANILSKYYEGTDTVILTPKAGLTSQFRKGTLYLPNPEFDEEEARKNPKEYAKKRFMEEKLHEGFPKNRALRDLNDYHHAHDAYLNAIVALYIYRQNPELRNVWVYGEYKRKNETSLGKWVRERKDKSMQLLSDMREAVWKQIDPDTNEEFKFKRDAVISNIEKTLDYHNVNVVKKTERQLGKFGKESIYKKSDTEEYASGVKTNLNPNKYGGTKSAIEAFSVIVKDAKGKVKSISVASMWADKYINSHDKLDIIQELYPKDKIISIVIDEVDKYTKFENEKNGNKITRLVASYQEAQKANSMTLSLEEIRGLEECNEDIMEKIYNKISDYLDINAVYNESNMNKWKGKIYNEFKEMTPKVQRQFIEDAFSIVKSGTTNAKGIIKERFVDRQRHKESKLDRVRKGTTLIYQSATGLYETRKKIK